MRTINYEFCALFGICSFIVYNYFASANTTKLLHFLKRYVRKSPSLLHLLSAGSVVR